MKNLILTVFAVSAIFLSGCMQSTSKYYINPDKSGKVEVNTTTPNMAGMFGGNQNAAPGQAELDQAVSQLVSQSNGIEAWKDLSATATEDGKIKVTGTAYFKDFNNLKIGSMKSPLSLTNENGKMTLTFVPDEKSGMNPMGGKKPGDTANMTDEQIRAKIKQQKMQFAQMKMMMAGPMADLKDTSIFYLPGTLASANGFTKTDDGKGAVFSFDGKQLMDGMDKMMNDEELMFRLMKKEDTLKDPNAAAKDPDAQKVMKLMFGFEEFPVAKTSGTLKAFFDYEKEAGTARTEWDKIKDKYKATMPMGGMPGMQMQMGQ